MNIKIERDDYDKNTLMLGVSVKFRYKAFFNLYIVKMTTMGCSDENVLRQEEYDLFESKEVMNLLWIELTQFFFLSSLKLEHPPYTVWLRYSAIFI